MVKQKSTQDIVTLYNQLCKYLEEKAVEGGWVTLVPADGVWRAGVTNNLVGCAYPLNIQSAYFSDTFILWADISKLHGKADAPAFHCFLQVVQWFFCKALQNGIPLRGAVATGDAWMDKEKSIYFGDALVEATRGEDAQHSIGIAYAPSVEKYYPIMANYILPFSKHIKENKKEFLSKRIVNWNFCWENSGEFSKDDVIEKINAMKNKDFSIYYDTAISIVNFARKHVEWYNEIDQSGIKSNKEFEARVDDWLNSVEQ